MPRESRMLGSRGPHVDSAMPPSAKSTITALRQEATPRELGRGPEASGRGVP
jgi:hypothetical protein